MTYVVARSPEKGIEVVSGNPETEGDMVVQHPETGIESLGSTPDTQTQTSMQ